MPRYHDDQDSHPRLRGLLFFWGGLFELLWGAFVWAFRPEEVPPLSVDRQALIEEQRVRARAVLWARWF